MQISRKKGYSVESWNNLIFHDIKEWGQICKKSEGGGRWEALWCCYEAFGFYSFFSTLNVFLGKNSFLWVCIISFLFLGFFWSCFSMLMKICSTCHINMPWDFSASHCHMPTKIRMARITVRGLMEVWWWKISVTDFNGRHFAWKVYELRTAVASQNILPQKGHSTLFGAVALIICSGL